MKKTIVLVLVLVLLLVLVLDVLAPDTVFAGGRGESRRCNNRGAAKHKNRNCSYTPPAIQEGGV